MKNKIVVVGSYNVDITAQTERLPQAGETVLGKGITFSAGGKGANQAVAAARAGADVAFIARVGADHYGETAILDLEREGIDCRGVTLDSDSATGMASITVDQYGENCIIVASGANARLSPQDIEKNCDLIAEAGILLIQLETPVETVEAALRCAKKHQTKVILNPAPALPLSSDLLKLVSIITPNEGEAELLTGIPIENINSLEKVADKLQAFGMEAALITLGANGVFLSNHEITKLIPAFQVKALDTTGAGDVFNGVLAACLGKWGFSLESAVFHAAAAASLSVTRPGAQSSIPRFKEVQQFINQFAESSAVPVGK
jgi:ribokinase